MSRHLVSAFRRRASSLPPSLVALALLLMTGLARADTITLFKVSGTAVNFSGGSLGSCAYLTTCSFSGTLNIDVTTGTLLSVDITLPGLSSFTTLAFSLGSTSNWSIGLNNGSGGNIMGLSFNTAPTAASLVGFTGGTHLGVFVSPPPGSPPTLLLYAVAGGSIVPAVPEPSSIVLLGTGLVAIAGSLRRKPGG